VNWQEILRAVAFVVLMGVVFGALLTLVWYFVMSFLAQ
jgi:hypothetical protein